ncbi:hypothetical protein EG328_006299 [Venturia inaequalis]|uniref:Ubiquitin carboxyl-terminal hydrolase n=1 Tax=Venturia inaequalis TaxID=5025 RepID=A0A8H3ZA56_VENIN|nr:hypothetical protein EG328_006299 [Venturia inaequalis]KAE9991885.1 hypothetical protein EG327_010672 [Venturia inaequalis]
MAPKRKTNVLRKNGQPTPTSTRMGTRSQTPASKATQGNTPAPSILREPDMPNGSSKIKTPASNQNQGPSTPLQKAGKAIKRTRKSVSDELTKANLAELSNNYEEPPDSPLSSPTGSMKEAVDHDYFNWSRHGSSSNRGEDEYPATRSVDSPSVREGVSEVPEEVTTQSNPSTPQPRETPTSAAASNARITVQIPPATTIADSERGTDESLQDSPTFHSSKLEDDEAVEPSHQTDHKDDIMHNIPISSELSQIATSEVQNLVGSSNELQGSISKNVSASISTESRRSTKRSLSSLDELTVPDPPVKSESSRTTARTRRTTKSKSPAIASQDDLACKPDEVGISTANEESTALRRSKRAKTGGNTVIEFDPDDVELPYNEATESEIEGWEGWLEMESSPETFTVMMREWGVEGIKAIDVWSLEPEDLVVLPQPVHGLVFCYPYRDGDESDQMDPCPDHVWFANQVNGTNACGTVALMNILNNIPNAKLGPALRSFRSDSQGMNAVERGDYLNNFRPIKAVHNSFIHVTEMMEDDLAAEKDHVAWEKEAALEAKKKMKAKLAERKKKAAERAARKQQRAAARAARVAASNETSLEEPRGLGISKLAGGVARPGVATKKKAPTKKANIANIKKQMAAPKEPKKETPAMAKAAAKKKADALARVRHHYVAYLPIQGELWKLDGMDDQPINLGPCDHATWIDTVVPLIQASMIDLSQESIDFSLLAVVQDPLYNDMMDLAANIKTMQQVSEKLAAVDPNWPMHEDIRDCLGDESLESFSEDYNVTEEMINEAAIPSTNQAELQRSDSVGSLLKLKKSLISQQKMLRSSIRSGKAEADQRQAQVNLRRRDFGPLIQWQLMDLIDEGVLDELLDLHDPKKQKGAGGSAGKGNGKAKPKGKGRK